MSHFDSLLKYCRSHSHIYCFGSGKIASRTIDFLNKYGVQIDGYILSDKNRNKVLNVPIYQIRDIISLLKNKGGIIFPLGEEKFQRILKKIPIPDILKDKIFFLVTPHDIITKINVDLAEGVVHFVRRKKWMDIFIENIANIELRKKEDFQKKYSEISKKYKKILVGQYYMRHIGEMCLTYYLWHIENNGNEDVFYVMNPLLTENDYDKIPNSYFYNKIKEKIEIIDHENFEFWRWMFQDHIDEIEFSNKYDWENMRKRDMDYINIHKNYFRVKLDYNEQQIINDMNLSDGFICIYNRDSEYYRAMGMRSDITKDIHIENARNSSIKDYDLLAEKYSEQGIPLVRMGYHVEENTEKKGIIDYANKYRTEKLDFYLISKCKFFMVSGSGIMLIAKLFTTPLVVVNSPVLSFGGDMVTPMSPKIDLIIMKKLWYQKQNRYLTLDEILYMEGKYKSYELFNAYHARGIVFHNNSQEELFEVAEEMRNRLEGNHTYTIEDEKLQERYRSILEKNVEKSKNHFYNGRFGASFLKKNTWFLKNIPIGLSIKETY